VPVRHVHTSLTPILTLFTMIPPRLCATNIIGRRAVCHRQCLSCLTRCILTSDSLLSKHRSETSDLARSYRYWQLTRELLWVFASYPQHRMRALGMSAERRSRSQWTLFVAVHVLSRCPFSPWTATILKGHQDAYCSRETSLLDDRADTLCHNLQSLRGCVRSRFC